MKTYHDIIPDIGRNVCFDPAYGPLTGKYGARNLIQNPYFTSGTDNWTPQNADISVVDTFLLVDDSANAGPWSLAYQTVTGLIVGATYRLKIEQSGFAVTGGGQDSGRSDVHSDGHSLSSPGDIATLSFNGVEFPTVDAVDAEETFVASTSTITITLGVDGTGKRSFRGVSLTKA